MDESVFSVSGGVHPVVASSQLTTFVSNDCYMQPHRLWIVTGPNMGGRDVLLTIAFQCIMHYKITVFVHKTCTINFDSARIGAIGSC